jgi:hypothetical protein
MKGKKFLFLFLALLFPVVIFLFLKIFGKNEFEVAILHQDGPINSPSSCGAVYQTPYSVADSLMKSIRGNGGDMLYVVYFDSTLQTALNRIAYEFQRDPVRPVRLVDEAGGLDLDYWRRCIFLMEGTASIVLLDSNGRIRGYYDGEKREEIDRLMVEAEIILGRY